MFWRRRTRLDEEVESHLAEETADNIARGHGSGGGPARRAAVRSATWKPPRKERASSIRCTGSIPSGRISASPSG